jgi:tetratricopeptide (TPR) repeat protein
VTADGERAGYRLGDGAAATRAAAGREQAETASGAEPAGSDDDADAIASGERDGDTTDGSDDSSVASDAGDVADGSDDREAKADADADSSDSDSSGARGDDSRDEQGDRDEAPAPRGGRPELPEEADLSALDPEIRAELRSLPKGLAEIVGRHLAAAGLLIDEEPELALEHARYARSKAARVGVVREAAGLTAYFADEWAEALSELRAARRMMTGPGHLAIMADCERALGRPERAIDLAKDPSVKDLSQEDEIELRIVAAGARRDMGQLDAAVVALQGPDLDPGQRTPYSARLFYAYADNLAAAGRIEEAVKWFLNAAEADDEGETDAAERAFELTQEETAQQ